MVDRPERPDVQRTFVALYPSARQREAVAALAGRLRRSLSAAGHSDERRQPAARLPLRFTNPEQTHLTLAFLGDVPAEALGDVVQAVARVAATVEPFEWGFRGLGTFPESGRPRVVWLDVSEGRSEVVRLAGLVREAVADATSVDRETPFRPHLTLARIRGRGTGLAREPLREAFDRVAASARVEPAPVREAAVVVSRLGSGGAQHRTVAAPALGAGDAAAPRPRE